MSLYYSPIIKGQTVREDQNLDPETSSGWHSEKLPNADVGITSLAALNPWTDCRFSSRDPIPCNRYPALRVIWNCFSIMVVVLEHGEERRTDPRYGRTGFPWGTENRSTANRFHLAFSNALRATANHAISLRKARSRNKFGMTTCVTSEKSWWFESVC